ncbi:MAG: DinB family protein [Candidatus Entotheonellia bacterium]
MTLQEITHLVAFNRWANERFFEALGQLPAEQYGRDLHSSHGGIHGTFVHIVAAEKGWLCRWLRQPETTTVAVGQIHSLDELHAYWEGVCAEMSQFMAMLDERKLQETLTTSTRTGTYTSPYWQMVQHVVDHSSYHRGQIVTMLRQLGVTPPSTGLIRFYRDAAAG